MFKDFQKQRGRSMITATDDGSEFVIEEEAEDRDSSVLEEYEKSPR